MYKLIISLLFLNYTYGSISHQDKIDMDTLHNKRVEKKIARNIFILGYEYLTSDIDHSETSGTSGFFSINNRHTITEHYLQLKVGREFFKESLFSIGLTTNLGRLVASNERKLNETYDVKDGVSGYRYGLGGSLNLNIRTANYRFQLFAGASMMKISKTYEVIYKNYSTGSNEVYIENKRSGDLTQINLGLRMFEKNNDFFSAISFNMDSFSAIDSSYSGNIGGTDLSLINLTSINEGSFSVGIEVGTLF